MKPKTLHIFFRRLLCWLLAIHVLNFSVNAPDYPQAGAPASQWENVAVNEMENVFEIILEKWLQCDNAVPEQDEPDADDESQPFEKEYYPPTTYASGPSLLTGLPQQTFLRETASLVLLHHPEITPPPPQA
ncbi:hypothetical protein [Tellurirhabdus rosea]|uniref:hypothetical protein n=1 Tax=Tellurirhabdus rosea TaxID=2674997 RepID=UPI00225A91C7|nr:hypothetical protein [Tellurirhabdus rosea]